MYFFFLARYLYTQLQKKREFLKLEYFREND